MAPTLTQILILSVVQGAAEPLPVSSSAHVIAAERLMHLDPSSPEMTFLLAMLHTGTVGAMIVYFWNSWRRSFFGSAEHAWSALVRIAVATAVTLAVYLALEQVIKRAVLQGRPGAEVEDLFSNLPLMAACLAAGGVLIVAAGLRSGHESEGESWGSPEPVGTAASVAIGAAQGLVLPFRGLSRSGVTISSGMLIGVPRRVAEEFSFALAVVITPPVILRELLRYSRSLSRAPGAAHLAALATPGLLGMAGSFVAGLIALRWLSGWLEKGRWHYFGFYCFAAAAGILVLWKLGY